jgi:hypothetical protein
MPSPCASSSDLAHDPVAVEQQLWDDAVAEWREPPELILGRFVD